MLVFYWLVVKKKKNEGISPIEIKYLFGLDNPEEV
jgi:hypothetical protein